MMLGKQPNDRSITAIPLKSPEPLHTPKRETSKATSFSAVNIPAVIPTPRPCGPDCEIRTRPVMEKDLNRSRPLQVRTVTEVAMMTSTAKIANSPAIDVGVNLLAQIAVLPFAAVETGRTVLQGSGDPD